MSKLPKYVDWIIGEYFKQIQLNKLEGSKRYKKLLDTLKTNTYKHFVKNSGLARFSDFQAIKYGYTIQPSGYVIGRFSVILDDSPEITYGYNLWERSKVIGNTIDCAPKYICLSPTYNSKDGEYRQNFISHDRFINGYDDIADLMSIYEPYIIKAMQEKRIVLKFQLYPNDAYNLCDSSSPEEYSDNTRLGIKTLNAAMFLFKFSPVIQDHIITDYKAMFVRLLKLCNFPEEHDYEVYDKITVFQTGVRGTSSAPRCGAKIMPLTVMETANVNDITFDPWREVYLSRIASDLVINSISGGVPIYNNWTYFDGIDESFYSTPSMKLKYEKSQYIKEVKNNIQILKDKVETYIDDDDEIEALNIKLYKDLLYIQDYIELTPITLCMINEFVGYTFRSQIDRCANARDNRGHYDLFISSQAQIRYIFEVCFAAFALHTKTGIIHSDLHLNNITVHERHLTLKDKDYAVAYVVGDKGEADTFLFPANGLYGVIIDFSRSLFSRSHEAGLIETYGKDATLDIFRKQNKRILQVLHHYLPEYVKANQDVIKGVIMSNWELLFPVVAAVDYLALGKNIGAYYRMVRDGRLAPEMVKKLPKEVAVGGIAIAERIESFALNFLLDKLTRIVGAKGAITLKELDLETPIGHKMFHAIFRDFKFISWLNDTHTGTDRFRTSKYKNLSIVDIYNITLELKSSGMEYKNYPYWSKIEVGEPYLKPELDINDITHGQGKLQFYESLKPSNYIELIREKIKHSLIEKEYFTSSSWV